MKYSIAAIVLSLVSTSWAASGAVNTIDTVAATLNKTIPTYEFAINQAAAQIKGAVSADVVVQAEAVANANLAAIAEALANAEASVLAATVNAAGGVQTAITGLVQSDLNTLASDVELIANAITGLGATFSLIVTLRGDVQAALQAEFSAVKAFIAPFANPIEAYIEAVLKSSVAATLTVTGIQKAHEDLQAAVASLGTF